MKSEPNSYSEYLELLEPEVEPYVDDFNEKKYMELEMKSAVEYNRQLISDIDLTIQSKWRNYLVEKRPDEIELVLIMNPTTWQRIQYALPYKPCNQTYKGFIVYTSDDVEVDKFKVLIG